MRIILIFLGEVRCGDAIVRILSGTEILILFELREEKANKIVERISRKYNIPKSTVWYNINKLRKKGLLFYENRSKIKLSKDLVRFIEELKKNISPKILEKYLKEKHEG